MAHKTLHDQVLAQTTARGGAASLLQAYQEEETPAVEPATETPVVAPVATEAAPDIKFTTCKDKMTKNFINAEKVAALDQFNVFVNDICPSFDLRVPRKYRKNIDDYYKQRLPGHILTIDIYVLLEGVIVASCFHTGYFLLRTLRPLHEAALESGATAEDKTAATDAFDAYVDDFCDQYDDVLPRRTAFVKSLNGIDDADAFSTQCAAYLQDEKNVLLNSWFDPIDPLSSITQKEICDLHFKLFESLRLKQRTSLSEYVSFSYLASLDLFLNAHQQEDFENCVNQDVVAQPNPWLTDFVMGHTGFKNWDPTMKGEVSAAVAEIVTKECADKETCAVAGSCDGCDGCTVAISRVYKEYEVYLNNLFASTFKDHSEKMFDKLHQANLAIQ